MKFKTFAVDVHFACNQRQKGCIVKAIASIGFDGFNQRRRPTHVKSTCNKGHSGSGMQARGGRGRACALSRRHRGVAQRSEIKGETEARTVAGRSNSKIGRIP